MNRKALYECKDDLKNITDDIEFVLRNIPEGQVAQYSGSEYMELKSKYNAVRRTLVRTLYEWKKIKTEGDIL